MLNVKTLKSIECRIVLISQVVEKLEEENVMLKENIQILEDSTSVSYMNCVSCLCFKFVCR